MKHLLPILISCAVFSSSALATTYQLSGQRYLAELTISASNPVPYQLSDAGGKPPGHSAISGTITYDTTYQADITIDSPDMYSSLAGIIETAPMQFTLAGNTQIVSDFNWGGYGAHYFEEQFTSYVIPAQTTPQQSSQLTLPATGQTASTQSSLTVDNIELMSSDTYTSYDYDDASQTGTPTISTWTNVTNNTYAGVFTVTHQFQVSGVDYSLDEYFQVTMQPVPLPAAGWLFATALSTLAVRARKFRRGS